MAASTTTITARIPEKLDAALQAVALTSGKPVGALVRQAIEDWLRTSVNRDEVLLQLAEARRRQAEEQQRVDALTFEIFQEEDSKELEAQQDSTHTDEVQASAGI